MGLLGLKSKEDKVKENSNKDELMAFQKWKEERDKEQKEKDMINQVPNKGKEKDTEVIIDNEPLDSDEINESDFREKLSEMVQEYIQKVEPRHIYYDLMVYAEVIRNWIENPEIEDADSDKKE